MTAQILSGKEVAADLRKSLQHKTASLKGKGIEPLLGIIIVGDAAPSQAYVRGIEKVCTAVGVKTQVNYFSADEQLELEDRLERLNQDISVHGIIVMRPLPAGFDEKSLGEKLNAIKDVDCFNPINAGRVMAGDKFAFPPCTPQAVMEILDYFQIPLQGRRAVVIGRSMVVGRPLAMLLLEKHATVTICHSRTEDMTAVCREADILVAAAGKPGLVKGEMIKPGAVVLDVGVNFVGGQMVGDVDFAAVSQLAGAITPVPGGVGSVTSTVLVKHVVEAAEKLTQG
ncbi:MAG: bifunctional 5,10-methylenetetrahydrofolate dehydrogenase/5,10-methenyltetrahydrofolate cyclohydrolase [bacterium]|jgi:methylenetetrahydrofolate dehydrogenase (NADP+)/methenyltetrahydrofolate cyclohydrolase